MMLTIRHVHLHSSAALDAHVEGRLIELGEAMQIEEVRVVLAFHAERSPAYAAALHVAVAGVDLTFEGSGPTAELAFDRGLAKLSQQVRARLLNRAQRRSRHRKQAANFRVGRRAR